MSGIVGQLTSSDTTTDGYAAADAPLQNCPEGLTALGWVLIAAAGVFLLLFVLCVLYRQQRSDPFGTDGFMLWMKRLICGGKPNPEELTPRIRKDKRRRRHHHHDDSSSEKGSGQSAYYDAGERERDRERWHKRNPSYDTPASMAQSRRPAATAYHAPQSAFSASGRSFRSAY